MAKLGALLLKGFKNRKFRSPVKPTLKKKASSRKVLPKNNGPKKVIPKVETALARTHQESEVFHQLSLTDLVKPEAKLKQSIESFLLDQRSEHTRRAYGKDLKRFVGFLIERNFQYGVGAIDRALIISYKDRLLSEELEHTTIDRHLATLRSFFRWLVEDGIITKNPAETVRFLNPKRESKTNGFTDVEVLQMLKVPNLYTKTGSLHYAILMMLFYCGMRRSELCSIRTPQLGFERGHHFVRLQGKGNAERIVVLVEPVWNAIQHYLQITHKDVKKDQPLFTPIKNNRTGDYSKPIDASMIFYIVTRCAKKAGIQNRVSPHSCRATAISNARDHQVPDRAIQEFAGWSTTTMITRYDKRKSSLEKSAVHSISYGEEAEERKLPTAEAEYLQKK